MVIFLSSSRSRPYRYVNSRATFDGWNLVRRTDGPEDVATFSIIKVVGDLDKNCYGFLPSFPSFSFISVRVFKYLYVLCV